MYSYNTVAQFVTQCNILLVGLVLVVSAAVLIGATLSRKSSLTPVSGRKKAHTVLLVHVSIVLGGIANIFYSFPSVFYNGSYWQQIGNAGDQAVVLTVGRNGMSNATVTSSYPTRQVYCTALVPPDGLLALSTSAAGFFFAVYSVLQDLLVIRLFSIIAASRSLSSGDNLNLFLSRGNVIFIIVLFLAGAVSSFFNRDLAVIIGSVALWCTAGFSLYLCHRIRPSLVSENLAGVKSFVTRIMLVRGTDFLVFTMSGWLAYMLQPQVGNDTVTSINFQHVMVQCSRYSLVFSVIPILYLPLQVTSATCQLLLTFNAEADVGMRTPSSSAVPDRMMGTSGDKRKASHQQASNNKQQVLPAVKAHSNSILVTSEEKSNDTGPGVTSKASDGTQA